MVTVRAREDLMNDLPALSVEGGALSIVEIINPRRMRSEGYSSRSVCLSVCQHLFSHYRLRGGL